MYRELRAHDMESIKKTFISFQQAFDSIAKSSVEISNKLLIHSLPFLYVYKNNILHLKNFNCIKKLFLGSLNNHRHYK